jgi:hypothetical protein
MTNVKWREIGSCWGGPLPDQLKNPVDGPAAQARSAPATGVADAMG